MLPKCYRFPLFPIPRHPAGVVLSWSFLTIHRDHPGFCIVSSSRITPSQRQSVPVTILSSGGSGRYWRPSCMRHIHDPHVEPPPVQGVPLGKRFPFIPACLCINASWVESITCCSVAVSFIGSATESACIDPAFSCIGT